jgi:hypothetical protein
VSEEDHGAISSKQKILDIDVDARSPRELVSRKKKTITEELK